MAVRRRDCQVAWGTWTWFGQISKSWHSTYILDEVEVQGVGEGFQWQFHWLDSIQQNHEVGRLGRSQKIRNAAGTQVSQKDN